MTAPTGSLPSVPLYRGETYRRTLTVTRDGARLDLTGCTLEFTVKLADGAPDADAFLRATTADGGIVLLDQMNAATKGMADIIVAATVTADLIESQYREDVWIQLPVSGERYAIVPPRDCSVRDPVNLHGFEDPLDVAAAALRLNLIRFLWNADVIPSYAPALVQQLGTTLPDEAMSGSSQLNPVNYSMDAATSPPRRIAGDFTTPNLDHYERWIMRASPHVPNSFLSFGIPWGGIDFVPGVDEGYVPVLYFAPTTPTTKMFLVHDGHGPYNFTGHRALIKWALDHGFGVLQVIMPEFGHNLLLNFDATFPQFAQFGHIHRIFLEATTSAITHAQGLGYSTFVMEGISGGGLTTHFMAAVDERITASYPVAGGWPHAMRLTVDDLGDWEQMVADPVYGVVSFADLFAMSASNGRHATQITHEFDPVCFAAHGREAEIAAYAAAAQARATGRFRSLIAFGQNVHDVLQFHIQTIEDDLRTLGVIP